ncbi:MAG: LCCL domain-containing protein [Acidimicrobiales bacterium]
MVETGGGRRRRSPGRVIAGVMLLVAIVGAAACGSDGDSTSTATSGAEEASTTTEPAVEPSEPVVFEGTFSPQDEILQLPEGFSNSFALEGDLVGQGAFVGTATPDGEAHIIEGDWAFNLRSPELGEGLIAVQQWDGLFTPTEFNATGEVTGVSGAFAGMVGTTSFTSTGTGGKGTYVFELQPAEPSPEPEPTEPLTFDFEAASGPAWVEEPAFGGGNTSTGDFIGSTGWTGDSGTGTVISINVGTLAGAGDGVFITVAPTPTTPTWTVQAELFGVSGAFAGLEGVGTGTGTTYDPTGAFAPESSYTFEVSSDELDGISWFRRADFYDLEDGPVSVDCRPEGLAHDLWGTDTYTDDSSICTAAAHAGLITLEEGGEVTFAFAEGQDVYEASERNGVTSGGYEDGWPRSFEFVEPS